LLGIRYGGVVCKYATAAVALKPVLLIERLSVVDNASGMAASAWLKTRAVGDSSDIGRCTKSERLEVCELERYPSALNRFWILESAEI
jgi:hypothetical protein